MGPCSGSGGVVDVEAQLVVGGTTGELEGRGVGGKAEVREDLADDLGLSDRPADPDVANDMTIFVWVNGVPVEPKVRSKGSRGETRHGDSGISFVLALNAAEDLGPLNSVGPMSLSQLERETSAGGKSQRRRRDAAARTRWKWAGF